ncbi:hypothetical protein [Planktothrix sp. FACHB-1365]|uniref:hypothetical protein n=1 Tax=Planktothrix sp. FACHB-1365 TaxID=2692855 RepID=UPI00168630C0|nr:hypothetical protein [Planktothrix sp. FACHB-1365]MBD2480493.1 hypothetical protein [Planktothrix sp. FACHB-1365]
MALKKTLYCCLCKRKTLHEEISYTEALEYAREKNILVRGLAAFWDYYPRAKLIGKTLLGFEAAMQCNSCGMIRGSDDSAFD